MAAPITDLNKGESVVGYSYWNSNVEYSGYDLGKSQFNGLYLETAINDKTIVGIESIKGSKNISGISLDTRFTDISLKSKVNENVQLIVGNRTYNTDMSYSGSSASDTTNKLFYGVGVTKDINEKVAAYVSITRCDDANDWQIGTNYKLNENTSLNLNYRYYDVDNLTLKGLGAGLSYTF
jgi:hypothetical protein